MSRWPWIVALIAVAVLLALVMPGMRPGTGPAVTAIEPGPAAVADDADVQTVPATAAVPLLADAQAPGSFPVAPAHGVTTIVALQRLIDTRGLEDPEVFHATAMALDLCDDERFPKQFTVQELIGRWQARGELQKAAEVAAMVNRLCTGRLSLDADPDRLAALTDPVAPLYAPGGPLADSQGLLEAAWAGQTDTDPGQLIRDLIANVSGMFEWLELFALLDQSADSGALLAALPGDHHHRHINPAAIQAGTMLAGCRLFGGCGPGTLLATMSCINSRCPHLMGLEEHTRYLLPGPEQEDAEAIARALLTLRHAPAA